MLISLYLAVNNRAKNPSFFLKYRRPGPQKSLSPYLVS
jgi:hypothetical protein